MRTPWNFDQRAAFDWAVIDSRRSNARIARARLVSAGLIDPECRFARASVDHVCVRSDGRSLDFGGECAYEAQAQVAEQGAVLREAEQAVEPATVSVPARSGGPVYRWVQP